MTLRTDGELVTCYECRRWGTAPHLWQPRPPTLPRIGTRAGDRRKRCPGFARTQRVLSGPKAAVRIRNHSRNQPCPRPTAHARDQHARPPLPFKPLARAAMLAGARVRPRDAARSLAEPSRRSLPWRTGIGSRPGWYVQQRPRRLLAVARSELRREDAVKQEAAGKRLALPVAACKAQRRYRSDTGEGAHCGGQVKLSLAWARRRAA